MPWRDQTAASSCFVILGPPLADGRAYYNLRAAGWKVCSGVSLITGQGKIALENAVHAYAGPQPGGQQIEPR